MRSNVNKLPFRLRIVKIFNALLLRNCIVCVCLFALLNNACVRSRLLKKNEYLYAGAKIKLQSDTAIDDKRALKSMLKDQTYPLPNSTLAGLPVKLWVNSIFGPGYIGDNYGEKP